MKHYITTNEKTKVTAKPKGSIGKVSNGIITKKEVTVKSFTNMMIEGTVWCPATLKGKRINKNWVSQSVFALDFDDGISPEEVLARLDSYNLHCNVIYTTFSDSPALRKFRVVFFLNELITDSNKGKYIIVNLMNLFTEADVACKGLAQMFFPGKAIEYINEEEVEIDKLEVVLGVYQMEADKGRSRKVLKVGEKPQGPIYYIEPCGKTPKNCNNEEDYLDYESEDDDDDVQEVIRGFDFELATSTIKIVSDFVGGTWLEYPQLLGLYSNFIHVEGGIKWMHAIMKKHNATGATNYRSKQFNIGSVIKRYDHYKPQRLKTFSPYSSDHTYHRILNIGKQKPGTIITINKPKLMTLKEAENKVERVFNDFFTAVNTNPSLPCNLFTEHSLFKPSVEPQLCLLKAITGIGKTRHITNLKGVLIALESNSLKWEMADRMEHDEFRVTPDQPIFNTPIINTLIKSYYDSDLGAEVSKLMFNMVTNTKLTIGGNIYRISEEDSDAAADYIEANRGLNNYEGTILTTHRRAFLTNFPHSTYIFDEDPMQHVADIGTCSLDFSCFDNTTVSTEVKRVEKHLRETLFINQMVETPEWFFNDLEELTKVASRSNFGSFLRLINSDFIMKTEVKGKVQLQYAKKNELPKGKNVLILSATASSNVWEALNPTLKVIDVSLVEQKGKLIQHTGRSYSRHGFLTYDNVVFEDLNNKAGNVPILTFKQYKGKFTNPMEDLHFGKCTGSDKYKGRKIIVVGTPAKPKFLYLLYAKLMGHKIKPSMTTLHYHLIERHGKRFWFMSFKDEKLRDIQLSLIEGELLQAVGRSRLTREEQGEVHLYSNLPLPLADNYIND